MTSPCVGCRFFVELSKRLRRVFSSPGKEIKHRFSRRFILLTVRHSMLTGPIWLCSMKLGRGYYSAPVINTAVQYRTKQAAANLGVVRAGHQAVAGHSKPPDGMACSDDCKYQIAAPSASHLCDRTLGPGCVARLSFGRPQRLLSLPLTPALHPQ